MALLEPNILARICDKKFTEYVHIDFEPSKLNEL